ncbi:MAG: hypothetical protein CMH97_09060 [Oceanospirillaceae bacterium]|uniref:hypothetical protein n=1 Tax=Thalassolituus sp. TaxID=2030822 RepID=UPI000C41EA82|nr:hypothetical protein [Thalassolituus sp.]MAE35371.1 hypothetical protein [Oceanospirillaceae bacterium]MDQ4423828.1 hypothetical protein [Thalassolituus sp.]MDQ4427558.1 hypothetical protein [Thalassolituus sp.]
MSSMIATNRRKLAYELGSKADTRQFIPFSKNTNTNNGRKVFIDAALAPLFAHFFQADDANTIRIVSKIEQLSAIAGGISANTNVTTPFEYMENIGELAIYYQLHSKSGDNAAESGVYITGVKRASKRSSTKAELIEITPWVTQPVGSDIAVHAHGAIHADEDTKVAAETTRNALIKSGLGVHESINLFFVPTPIKDDMGLWMTPDARSIKPQEVAKKLANVITATQKYQGATTKRHWTVEGDTVKLLQLTLEHLPTVIDRHEFTLINPVADIALVANTLERAGAKVTSKTTDSSRAKAAVKLSSERSNSQENKELAAKVSNGNTALAAPNTHTIIKSTFIDYVKNLTGSLAW